MKKMNVIIDHMEKSKKVLLIEDELPLIKVIREKFLDQPFITLEARDGDDGLRLALNEHPDVILLDIIMPKMDGLELLRQLRNDEWGKNAKVIVLTNLSDRERLEEAEKLNVKDYLVKTDWKIENLLEKVLESLANNK